MGNLGKIGKPQKSKKHKKLKPVDPFNRGARKAASDAVAKKTDKTPKGDQLDDQQMSRSMKDFIRSKKMMEEQLRNPRQKEKKRDAKINDYQSNDDRRGMTRPERPVPEFHKKKGERDYHFVGRASAVAAEVVGESRFEDKYKLNANPTQDELDEKKQRKEEWKKKKAEKREKRKRKRAGAAGDVNEEILAYHKKNKEDEKNRQAVAAASSSVDPETSPKPKAPKKQLTDFSELRDEVKFGEVVMAPPTLTAKPRKAETTDVRNRNLLLAALWNGKGKNNQSGDKKTKDNTDKGMKKLGQKGAVKKSQKLKTLSALQKSTLLNERQKVVDKYRKLKAGNLAKLC